MPALRSQQRARARGRGSPRMAVDLLHGIQGFFGQMDPDTVSGVLNGDVMQGVADTAASAAATMGATAGEVAEEAKKDPGLFDKFVNVVMSAIEGVHGAFVCVKMCCAVLCLCATCTGRARTRSHHTYKLPQSFPSVTHALNRVPGLS